MAREGAQVVLAERRAAHAAMRSRCSEAIAALTTAEQELVQAERAATAALLAESLPTREAEIVELASLANAQLVAIRETIERLLAAQARYDRCWREASGLGWQVALSRIGRPEPLSGLDRTSLGHVQVFAASAVAQYRCPLR